ncbi:hypothetical protein ASG48_06730 [Aurantimonas sp. Leaf443]|nr:hypothetical protein ASG48_06730 [Aurantimonas sp. Leaf443]
MAAVLAGASLGASPALAVFSGDMSPKVRSGDSDYADGVEAFDEKDWPAAITALSKVVARRPHHDNAWAMLGFSLRKSGNYERSLDAYGRSLSINPTNRAAMEYLGEAYLDLGRVRDAKILLIRLANECTRVALTFSDGDFKDGCTEFKVLDAAIKAYELDPRAPVKSEPLPW